MPIEISNQESIAYYRMRTLRPTLHHCSPIPINAKLHLAVYPPSSDILPTSAILSCRQLSVRPEKHGRLLGRYFGHEDVHFLVLLCCLRLSIRSELK